MGKIDPNLIMMQLAYGAFDYMTAALGLMFIYLAINSIAPGVGDLGTSIVDKIKNRVDRPPSQKKPSAVVGFAGKLMPDNIGGAGIRATEARLWWLPNASEENVSSYTIYVKRPMSRAKIVAHINEVHDHSDPFIINLIGHPEFSALPTNPHIIFEIRAKNTKGLSRVSDCIATQDSGGTPAMVAEMTRLRDNAGLLDALEGDMSALRSNMNNDFISTGHIEAEFYETLRDILRRFQNLSQQITNDIDAIRSRLTDLIPSQVNEFINLETDCYRLINLIREDIKYIQHMVP